MDSLDRSSAARPHPILSKAATVARTVRDDPGFRLAVFTAIAVRVALEVIALVASALMPPHAYAEQRFFTAPSQGPLLAPFAREDAVWYQHIAESGYDVAQSTAFMPLFPLLIRLAGAIIGSPAVASLLIPTLATAAALWLLYHLASEELGPVAARRAVVLTAVAPAAYFLWSPFSEGLFLLESVTVFWLARRQRYAAAGAVVGLAVLTRLQGVLLLVPLVTYVMLHRRSSRVPGLAPTRMCWQHAAAVAVPCIPGLSALAALIVGFSAGGFHTSVVGAQALWGAHVAAPWTVIASSVATVLSGRQPEELLNLVSVAAVGAALPVMWRRLPPPYTLFSAASLLAILCHTGGLTPLMSASRFVTVIFPLFMLLGAALSRSSRFRLAALTSAAACALLFTATVEYVFVA